MVPAGLYDALRMVPNRWAIWAVIGVGTFVNVLDNHMLNVSIPTIRADFRVDVATVQWLTSGYMLVIGSLLLTASRLADVYGRKRLYLIGMALFIGASVLAALAPTAYALIACRLLQGIGSALVQGVGMAIIVTVFPQHERGRALGLNVATVALGAFTGPILGGIISELFGWRWIFWFRIPIAIACWIATVRLVPPDPVATARRRFDFAGGTLVFLALGSLLLALSQGRFWGWTSPEVIGLVSLSIVLWILFFIVEVRVPEPMVPLAVFRNRMFSSASASAFFSFSATSSSMFLMPFFLIEGLGLPPSQAGFVLVPAAAMMSVSGPLSGLLSDRFGSRWLSPLGLFCVASALAALSRLGPDAAIGDVIWRSALMGFGMGTFQSPNNNSIVSAVPREQVGLASGTANAVRNLGNVVGIAAAATIVANRQVDHAATLSAAGLAGAVLEAHALIISISDAFVVAACLAALGFLVATLRGEARPIPDPARRMG